MGLVAMRVPLTLACGAYDRTAGLARGEIQPEGVDLTVLTLPVEETFFRMTRHREFDAAEMSLSSYLISLQADAPFVGIPVFLSRSFRHNWIYVPAASQVTAPSELAGGLVGVAEYQLTANVWIRGILAERHGLAVGAVRYRTGGQHTPGRVAKVAHDLGLESEGYRIVANHGPQGGQLVLHFHVHIIGGRQMAHRVSNPLGGSARE